MNNKEFTKRYYIDRSDANTIKWQRGRKLGCLPMWVADMDFACDERIIESLQSFIASKDFGYNNLPEDYYKVFIDWHTKRNNINYKQEWIRFSRGAVDALYQIIYTFTKKDDAIMINTPLYPPFKATIKECSRKVVESRLINNDGYFTFDFDDMENKFKSKKVKMLMLCSPHNPVGRVWKKGELETLFELCRKYKVKVCADEVHSDIIMPDQKFIPALSFKKYHDLIITVTAASKSFSLAVFSHCHIIIADEKMRNKLVAYQRHEHRASLNVMCALPTYYAYKYGNEWMDNLNNVIFENYNYFYDALSDKLEITSLEGSYLIFVNFKGYSDDKSAAKCLEKNCHLLVNPGESFDSRYNDWVRINLATSLDNVKIAVKNISDYLG